MQIQPVYSNIDRYAPLYEKEGLFFEILDLSFFYWDEADFEAAIRWYKQSNRVKSMHGYFIDINPASADPVIRAHSREACNKSCEIAKRMGADGMVFHSSCFPNLRGSYMDSWAKTAGGFFSQLADKHSMKIYIENSADLDPDPIKALIEEASNDKVKVCLDSGHAFLSRAPLEKWMDELHDYVGYVHLSDNMGHFDDHMPLGTGRINLELLDDFCRTLPSDTRCTLEVGGVEDIEKSIEYIKETGRFSYFL